MVQRLSLFGTVSPGERVMAVKCLQSISGVEGSELEIVREVWEPKFRFDPNAASQVEQYRLFVIKRPGHILLESYETPEAGKNIKVVSQSVLSSEFLDKNYTETLIELGYEHKSTHLLRGIQFVLREHVIVHLFQIFSEAGTLLDDSEQNIVYAFVDVASVRDLAAVQRGTQMLLGIQQELRGVIVLRIPNRNSFNTRMPRVQV